MQSKQGETAYDFSRFSYVSQMKDTYIIYLILAELSLFSVIAAVYLVCRMVNCEHVC